ncbi:phage protein [Clostridia bacterium]|nr:phage protein [Clostridia bacterium]
MREILFRGRGHNGLWNYGDHVRIDGKSHIKPDTYEMLLIEVDPDTVGQYTGLEDKNGVNIFEGDIARDSTSVFKVEFRFDGWHFVRVSGFYQYPSFYSNANRVEVIGNIHDNPKLLEESQ